MGTVNKTRYAILGMLLEEPRSGYEIKSLMERSTAYFWRESDSTIYPMLKRLAQEGKVQLAEVVHRGKRKREIFAITEAGKEEFRAWLESSTGPEVRRSEFLLKLFFATAESDQRRLLLEELESAQKTYEEFKRIEERLAGLPDSPEKAVRLKSLRHGMAHLALDIEWFEEEVR